MDNTNSPESSFYHRANNFLQKNILGLIILGLFINDLSNTMSSSSGFIFNAVLRTLTFVFHSYVETIHREIGAARSDQLVKTIYTVLISMGITLSCVLTIRAIATVKGNHKRAEQIKLKARRLADLMASIKALEDKITSYRAAGNKSIEAVEEVEKELDGLRKEKEQFLALEDKAKGLSDIVEESDDVTTKLKRLKRKLYYGSVFALLLFAYLTASLVGELYTRDASTFVERSIEILAPTIPPDKHLQLRAKYRSVDSAQKFYDLHDELQTIAKEKNVKLPSVLVIKR